MYLYQKQLVTIVSITKHPLNFCSSRQMDVVVQTKEGQLIAVPWAEIPCMATSGSYRSKPTSNFAYFWHKGVKGMEAYLWHGVDANCNFLEPI